jgi:hypothetical protein
VFTARYGLRHIEQTRFAYEGLKIKLTSCQKFIVAVKTSNCRRHSMAHARNLMSDLFNKLYQQLTLCDVELQED